MNLDSGRPGGIKNGPNDKRRFKKSTKLGILYTFTIPIHKAYGKTFLLTSGLKQAPPQVFLFIFLILKAKCITTL